MKHKLTSLIAAIVATLSFSALAITPVFATGECSDICSCSTVTEAAKAAYGCKNTDQGSEADFSNALQGILNGVISSLGLVAVIVIVIGGVMYMTSNGDAGKLQKAKNTILYAAIGLIICVLSFAITNFAIYTIGGKTGANDPTTTQKSTSETIKSK